MGVTIFYFYDGIFPGVSHKDDGAKSCMQTMMDMAWIKRVICKLSLILCSSCILQSIFNNIWTTVSDHKAIDLITGSCDVKGKCFSWIDMILTLDNVLFMKGHKG